MVNETSWDDVTGNSDFREGGNREGWTVLPLKGEGRDMWSREGPQRWRAQDEIQPREVSHELVLKGDALCSGCIFAR